MGKRTFFEFFAGGGMVRAGLGLDWDCLFANDIEKKKAESYRENWGHGSELVVKDIQEVDIKADAIGNPDLVWGSFPCQDLSVAGNGLGLGGQRSGTFFDFWKIVGDLSFQKRRPSIVAIENVVGAITSNSGRDFHSMCSAFSENGYRFGPMVVDAASFVPQSRPRLFIIGIDKNIDIRSISALSAAGHLSNRQLNNAFENTGKLKSDWVWWNLEEPNVKVAPIGALLQKKPVGVVWHTMQKTQNILKMMDSNNIAKVGAASMTTGITYGCIYFRTRKTGHGQKIQRAEVRFDGLSGCLRTPSGGSSRQVIIAVEGNTVRTRLISARETARLMGLDDAYRLPKKYNQAYHLTGDGVVVPVVRYLRDGIFDKIDLRSCENNLKAA